MSAEDNDQIRAQDTPKDMQPMTPSIPTNVTLAARYEWQVEGLDDAAPWVLTRLSLTEDREFLQSSGRHHKYPQDLAEAIEFSLRCLFILEFNLPYIYTYKRDYITYLTQGDARQTRPTLLDWTRHLAIRHSPSALKNSLLPLERPMVSDTRYPHVQVAPPLAVHRMSPASAT